MKQVSVFIENRAGSLRRLAKILMQNNINILSFSLADTSNYGLMRLLVDEPERAVQVLNLVDLSPSIADVYGIHMQNKVGELHRMFEALKDVQIEYLYPASTVEDRALVVCRIAEEDEAKADQALKDAGFSFDGPNGVYEAD